MVALILPYKYRRSHASDSEEQVNWRYYTGDHFASWIGPRINPNEPRAGELMREVERIFQSVNFIAECCDRHTDAQLGNFPRWFLKTEDGDRADTETDATAAEAEAELQRWIDAVVERAASQGQLDPFYDAALKMNVTGKAGLRLWRPARFVDADDPIDQIHLHSCPLDSLKPEHDEEGFIKSITYKYGNNKKQVQTLDGDQLRIEGNDIDPENNTLDTGGRWAIALLRSPSLLTPQIKRNQDAVNHQLTMMMRNGEQAGFLERIFLNAQMPGAWEDDPNNPGQQRFVPAGLSSGPGLDTFISGVEYGDPSNPSYTTPSVFVREPVNPKSFTEQIQTYRTFIYHQFGQGHLLEGGDGALAGISRIQLRQDFERKLLREKRTLEGAIANIFAIVLRLLGYSQYLPVVSLSVTTGKLTPEEQGAIIGRYDKGLLSKSTAMALLGDVEDTDAELALITEEEMKARRRSPSPLSDPLTDPSLNV